MRAYQIVMASVAMCSGLLFTSYLKAAEADGASPVAQMNRATYLERSRADPVFVPPRRAQSRLPDLTGAGAGSLSPAGVSPKVVLPRRPEDTRQFMPVVAQSNRLIYDR